MLFYIPLSITGMGVVQGVLINDFTFFPLIITHFKKKFLTFFKEKAVLNSHCCVLSFFVINVCKKEYKTNLEYFINVRSHREKNHNALKKRR